MVERRTSLWWLVVLLVSCLVLAGRTAAADSVDWVWVNPDGFGACQATGCDNIRIAALVAHGGRLFAGTASSLGAEIWQYDGATWLRQVAGGLDDPQNTVIASFGHYRDTLYAGTQQGDIAGAELWAYDGSAWSRVLAGGFDTSVPADSPKNTVASALCSFNDSLYIGTRYDYGGAEIWAYDGLTVTQVVSHGLADAGNVSVLSFVTFNGSLYAGTLNYSGAEVWRSGDGVHWTRVVTQGLGSANNIAVNTLAVMSATLYAGIENPFTGAEVWRSSDGLSWQRIVTGGFGDADVVSVNALLPSGGVLFATTSNATRPDAGVWAYDGVAWTRVVTGALWYGGQAYTFYQAGPLAELDGALYMGTSQAYAGDSLVGAQVWRRGGGTLPTPTATSTPTRRPTLFLPVIVSGR